MIVSHAHILNEHVFTCNGNTKNPTTKHTPTHTYTTSVNRPIKTHVYNSHYDYNDYNNTTSTTANNGHINANTNTQHMHVYAYIYDICKH